MKIFTPTNVGYFFVVCLVFWWFVFFGVFFPQRKEDCSEISSTFYFWAEIDYVSASANGNQSTDP